MFSRRTFFKLFSGLPFVFIPAQQLEEKRKPVQKVFLLEEFIAGFQYYDGMNENVFRNLQQGDALILKREKKNPYDENALAIFTRRGKKLGYIPRALNQIPANLADQKLTLTAEISEIDPKAETWERVRVKIFMEIEKNIASRIN